MKNKARLSIMTAFSFGKPLKNLIKNQLSPLKRAAITAFFHRVTSQYETSKSSLTPTKTTLLITMKWWPSPEGGIVLSRLLVPVYIRVKSQKAGIPKSDRVFKTKPQLALDMIREHIDNDVHFDYVNGDGLYGNGFEFSKGLAALGVKYILETHCDQLIFTQEPRIAVPIAEPGKRGRQPSLPKTDRPGITVEKYATSLHKRDFKEVRIRPTTKGWLTAWIHVATVWVWDKKAGDQKAIQQTLVIRKPIDKKDKTKYSLSNISQQEQSIEEFAFMQAQRFWIERCFRDDSHDLGMSDYQVRLYKGFFNHMALTSVAMEYILTERLENVQDVPLLSTNDIRILIAKEIRSRDDYTCDGKRFEQLEKRHIQRQRDIDRYYNFNVPK